MLDDATRWCSRHRGSSQFENNYFTEMCSGSEAGSYLRLVYFVYHSTLGLRVIKKKKQGRAGSLEDGSTDRGTSLIRNTHPPRITIGP